MTNHQKIIAMPIEEMAEFVFDTGNGTEYCYDHCAYAHNDDCQFWKEGSKSCLEGVKKWLESETRV